MKRFLTLLLVLSILTCFAACGQKTPAVGENKVLSTNSTPLSAEEIASSVPSNLNSEILFESSSQMNLDSSNLNYESASQSDVESSPSTVFYSYTESYSFQSEGNESATVTSEEIKSMENEFEKFIYGISVEDISKFEVGYYGGGFSPAYTCKQTTDLEMIREWINVLHSLEVKAVLSNGEKFVGTGNSYYYYDSEGTRYFLFSKDSSRIFFVDDRVFFEIEAYNSDLENQLLQKMGFY